MWCNKFGARVEERLLRRDVHDIVQISDQISLRLPPTPGPTRNKVCDFTSVDPNDILSVLCTGQNQTTAETLTLTSKKLRHETEFYSTAGAP